MANGKHRSGASGSNSRKTLSSVNRDAAAHRGSDKERTQRNRHDTQTENDQDSNSGSEDEESDSDVRSTSKELTKKSIATGTKVISV